MKTEKFRIKRFEEIGTGQQDYGHGVVRMHTTDMSSKKLGRNDIVRISNPRTQHSIWAIVRGRSIGKNVIALEYDHRRQLGLNLEKDRSQDSEAAYDLCIEKTSMLGIFPFVFNHIDIVSRYNALVSTFIAFILTIISIVIGLK